MRFIDKKLQKKQTAWFFRFFQQMHTGLIRRLITFTVITAHTGTYQIVPAVFSPEMLRNDVVDSQRDIGFTAVLTGMTIPAVNIFAVKDYCRIWFVNINIQTDNARKCHAETDGAYFRVQSLHNFCFSKENQDYRFSDIAYGDRFVV